MKRGKHRNNTLAARASRALGWNFASTALSKLGGLGISIMLARMLGPHIFGAYAVALVALYAMQTFNELGMSMAIVRWEADPRDIIPTVTTVSVAVSVVIYAGCFWIAPAYASAMGAPAATDVVRVLALAILIDGFCNTPAGLLQRRFQQGKATIATQVGTWTGTGLTVALAWSHHGAMSLAIGQVAGSLIVTGLLIAFAPESLRFGFNPAKARALLRFGVPLSGSNLIAFAVTSVDQVFVGHLLGATSLGLYVLAFNLSSWPLNMFSPAVRNVAPAVFSRLQHNQSAMRSTLLSAARILTAVTLPICLLIGGAAVPLIEFVYGVRWLPASQPLLWLALVGGARILFWLAYDYLAVLARTRLLLVIQLVWLAALIPSLIVTTRAYGIYGAGLAEAAVALLVVLPCYLASLRKAGVGLAALGKSLLLPVATAAVVGLTSAAASMLAPSNLIALAVSAVITAALIALILYRTRPAFALLRGSESQSARAGHQPIEKPNAIIREDHLNNRHLRDNTRQRLLFVSTGSRSMHRKQHGLVTRMKGSGCLPSAGSIARHTWEAVRWRVSGYWSMARALCVLATWDRAQRVKVVIPCNDRVPVIFCTWQRLERIGHILDMLAAQDVPVQALIWNNSQQRELVEKGTASARIPVHVYHSPRNIGSFGRFYLARELAESGCQRVIIIDDDEDFGPNTVRELLAGCPPRSLSAWFAYTISGQDYWMHNVPAPGEPVNYVGPGGMAADTAVFADSRLFSCPRRFWFLDDLWLSWYATNFADYTLLRSAAKMEFVEDSLNQFPRLQWVRLRFWRYLARQAVPSRRLLQEWK